MNVRHAFLNKWYLVITFIAVSLISSGVPLYVYGVEGRVIRKVEIRGNKRITTSAIKAAIRVREGDDYDPEIVNRDVDAMWAMGFFDNIEVKIEPLEDGLKLIYVLTERAVIKQIILQGNENIKTRKLKDILEIRENDYLKYYLLKLEEDRLTSKYVEKGYHLAEVKSEVEVTDGEAVVSFIINEGPEIFIASIVFEGNKSFKDKKLKKQINSRKRRFPSILFPGRFKRKEFEADIDKLKEFYSAEGWLDVSVKGEVKYSADNTEITLIFHIEEGERYYVGNIVIRGNTIYSRSELRAGLRLREGDPFLKKWFEEDSRQIKLIYGEQGFLKATVDPKRFFTPEKVAVDITYEITENQRFYVNKIKITGNDRTKDNVIRRELEFYPGDRIDTDKIRDAHRRLLNTGFFDTQSGEPTSISFDPGPEPDEVDILVDVREGQTGLLRFGGGFGANVGPFADASYSDRNFDLLDFPKDFHDFISGNAFRGAGHVVTLRFSPGVFRQELIFSFFNPAVFDSTYSAGFNLFLYKRVRSTYDEDRKGVRFTVGKELINDLKLRIVPGFEIMEISNLEDDAPASVREAEGEFSRLGLELRFLYDKRDNYYFPTKGYEVGASFEATALDVKIAKSTVYGKKYLTVYDFPYWGKHVLTLAGTVGVVSSTGEQGTGSTDVPIFERYFAGGYGSIRGFQFRGVSPIEATEVEVDTDGDGVADDTVIDVDQVGGDSLLLLSLEYSVPIYKDLVRAVTFIDTGKADEEIGDLNFTNFRASAGFGVRLTMPFFGRASIAIDYGIPFMKEPGDETQSISFNMGSGTSF